MVTKPMKYTDPVELQEKIDSYFRYCENTKKEYQLKSGDIKIRQEYPTVSGLAAWLGLSYSGFNEYCNGNINNEIVNELVINNIVEVLARAKTRICKTLENASMNGDAEPRTVNGILARVQGNVEQNIHVVIDGNGGDYSV